MLRRLTAIGMAIGALVLIAPRPAGALPRYRIDSEMKACGSIEGVVRLEGAVPAPRRVKVTAKERPCHDQPVPDETLVVSKDGRVRWAVVSIKKIAKGKPFATAGGDKPATLAQTGCRFIPHVLLVPVGARMQVLNNDGILHNVHLLARRNEGRNIAMAGSRKPLNLRFRWPERIQVKCDAHTWMGAWIVTTRHPYHAVTDASGKFHLDKVPAGTYRLEVWHEKLGKLERKVTVVAGKAVQVDFALRKK